MKQEKEQIEKVRDAFAKMHSLYDLLELLNLVKPLIYGKNTKPFALKQITWYANPKISGKRYAEFKINKKTGGYRTIHAPVKGLKAIQRTIAFILQCVFEPNKAATGFIWNRSIVDNAKAHVGNRYVYNIDLKDFFSSIDQARVWKCLQLEPFNLNSENSEESQWMKWDDFKREYLKTEEPINFYRRKDRLFAKVKIGDKTSVIYVSRNFDKNKEKFVLLGDRSIQSKKGISLDGTLWLVNSIPQKSRLSIANIISSLCCSEMEVERKNERGNWIKVNKNVLPQGAPTSPVLTNIVCQRLDFLLSGVAKRFGLGYTRYADDITFSSMHNVYQNDSVFRKELERIIVNQNFDIKDKKSRLQKDGYRKEVTGLLTNEMVNVQQRYIKQLRLWLYYWERYGYDRASKFFLQQYIDDKGHVNKKIPDIAKVIAGKLDYLKMVLSADNKKFLNLQYRFDRLIGRNEVGVSRTEHLSHVLDTILESGLDNAMISYKPVQ